MQWYLGANIVIFGGNTVLLLNYQEYEELGWRVWNIPPELLKAEDMRTHVRAFLENLSNICTFECKTGKNKLFFMILAKCDKIL